MTLQVSFNDGQNNGEVIVCEGDDGYARCGVSFNPTQDAGVVRIKALAAGLMQELSNKLGAAEHPDAKRCFATAMTQLESAQMFGVKGTARQSQSVGAVMARYRKRPVVIEAFQMTKRTTRPMTRNE